MAYLSLSTANLPDPAINNAENEEAGDHFNTVTYSGTSGDKAVTGVGFQPDWVWIKQRNSAADHQLYDSVRGVTKLLEANQTTAEQTKSEGVKSFDSDGFTHGVESAGNDNSGTHVAWNWKAGTSFSNSAGSNSANSDSAGSVNTKAGFSVLTYTGNGNSSNAIFHGLGSTPDWLLIKARTATTNWVVNHVGKGMTSGYLFLDGTNTFASATNNLVAVGSNTFSVGVDSYVNGNGVNFSAICFAGKDGYSKFGSYDGNGDADGPFIYTGFRPAWLMIKNADFAEIWPMFDNKRDIDNLVENPLYANLTSSESAASSRGVDFLSNGFKIRGTDTSVNRNGDTHIYMAFAEQPFKFSNAR